MYERRLAATDRSIESRLFYEGPVRLRQERSWRHDWLRIAGALHSPIGRKTGEGGGQDNHAVW